MSPKRIQTHYKKRGYHSYDSIDKRSHPRHDTPDYKINSPHILQPINLTNVSDKFKKEEMEEDHFCSQQSMPQEREETATIHRSMRGARQIDF